METKTCSFIFNLHTGYQNCQFAFKSPQFTSNYLKMPNTQNQGVNSCAATVTGDHFDENDIANRGMIMLINNNLAEAEELFKGHQ